MNKDLEELILAFEAASQARDRQEESPRSHLEDLLTKVLEANPDLDRESLRKTIIRAHYRWTVAQSQQPPTIPPKA